LVDGLMEAGYAVRLVNTAAVRQYEGLKHSDDEHDAFWLAHLMRLGILPTRYIYPKSERGLRDLARQRFASGPPGLCDPKALVPEPKRVRY
jgi:transposase